ncbi:MAG: HAD family phosphatase [Acidimicrobiia bacterium]|nr:HAD family phosphatase [Acidimicrobiia bacterium]
MANRRVLYVDVDGTLVGPGGDLFWDGSTTLAEALLAARAADLSVVPVTGRGRVQVRELCRLLGFPRGIGELGCVHLEGNEARYELGDFPFVGETPVEAFLARGVLDLVRATAELESHDPWNEGREATLIMRGRADVVAVNETLGEHGFGWCELVDNGALSRRPGWRAYHLAPAGTGKVAGVAVDRQRHGIEAADAFYVGDSAADLACAPEVGECWLVANAEDDLEWPLRTEAPYGAGVAEVITRLLG